ncbi:unnamed protein product [Psylliodes chrysocephalus]|uniref:Uncharacterized protein n=1 Tax=Psylliodes chrysocephalus TaxID=3402493 RepID=A0A9P0GAY6_9CUCU|nr:unnamed protein product [Psylliodes chrysocephala]
MLMTSQTSADFDKEPSTSTASTSSKITCLFCDRTQKRCGRQLLNLIFPRSEKLPLQKNMAENFGDSEILSKLQHQTVAYHQYCHAVYQTKEKRSTEESTDSSYVKYRQLNKLASESLSNFITIQKIENNKVVYFADTRIIFHAYKAAPGSRILIKASDTDVLIILLGNMHEISKSEIWLANSATKKDK